MPLISWPADSRIATRNAPAFRPKNLMNDAENPALIKKATLMTDRSTTLGQLAALVGGQVHGDRATPIRAAAVLGEVSSGEITLIDQPERVKQLAATQAAAVVVSDKISFEWPAAIVVADVHAAFAKIVCYFR